MKNRLSLILCIISGLLALTGCREESLEKEGFQLYYSGVTNIGPNMGVNLQANWFGGVPSDFAITGVLYEKAEYDGPEFSVNPEDGTVTIAGVPETKPGEYTVSVSCKVAGRTLNYPDIITVTFFKGIPDGITVTPDSMLLELADLKKDSQVKDTTAVVKTDGDHIAITGYRIANVRFGDEAIDNVADPHFSISDEGVITVLKNDNFKIGTYSVDLKINTSSFGSASEEGLFADALTIKVISVPISFNYVPSSGLLEEETIIPTSFRSAVPVMTGSHEGVVWSIAGCTPENNKLKIDPETGVLTIEEGHALTKDVTYVIDVNVKNLYSKDEGLTITEAYTIEIVEYIAPIEYFGYEAVSRKMATGWTLNPDSKTDAGHIRRYSWADPEAYYTKELTLDPETGAVAALKGNRLEVGTHEVRITAENGKEGGEVTATLNLEITDNPYHFTYFSYGNNLNLTEEQTKGVSQFRVKSSDELSSLTAEIQFTDMSEKARSVAVWSAKNCNKLSKMSIDTATGTIAMTEGSEFTGEAMGITLITAVVTDPEDAENSFRVTMPFCVDFAATVNDVTITFDPFVFRVNPKTGGRSVSASHDGITADKLLIDFRRSFNYYNIYGEDENGVPFVNGAPNKDGGSFLKSIWDKFTEDTGLNKKDGATNYGAKLPVSFYNNSVEKTGDQLSKTGVYLDNTPGANQFTVVVSPGIWYVEGWADGIFTGQMTFAKDGTIGSVNGGGKRAPVSIWLDKDFEE